MFKIFKFKRNESLRNQSFMQQNNYNVFYEEPAQPAILKDTKMIRLIELISCAIEDWAKEYHLENLPKKIIFEQALDAMKALEIAINNSNL